jgi:tight adherence protein C
MIRILIPLTLINFVGLTLLLSEFRWFRRVALVDRLAPYAPGAGRNRRIGLLSVESFRDVIAPLSQSIGERLSQLFGISEELGTRLRRIHSPLDAVTFRVRQLGWTFAAFGFGAMASLALSASATFAIMIVLGAPILTFLLQEQQVAAASAAWQRKIFLELPVVAEQLGMLTSAGWSLGAALARVAARGSGACSADLQRVIQRIRQGLSEAEALREWAELADVDELDRLVAVLSMNREATDLGRLIADEARSVRREAQRELIETIERRNQQVWIPVTVAALLPGVLLMGIPFLDALTLFGA